jgi:hypothetical protein
MENKIELQKETLFAFVVKLIFHILHYILILKQNMNNKLMFKKINYVRKMKFLRQINFKIPIYKN